MPLQKVGILVISCALYESLISIHCALYESLISIHRILFPAVFISESVERKSKKTQYKNIPLDELKKKHKLNSVHGSPSSNKPPWLSRGLDGFLRNVAIAAGDEALVLQDLCKSSHVLIVRGHFLFEYEHLTASLLQLDLGGFLVYSETKSGIW